MDFLMLSLHDNRHGLTPHWNGRHKLILFHGTLTFQQVISCSYSEVLIPQDMAIGREDKSWGGYYVVWL